MLFRRRNFPSLLGGGIRSHLLALLRSLRSALLRSPLLGLLIGALLFPASGRRSLLALLLLALNVRLPLLLLLLLQIALLLLVIPLLFLEVPLLVLITLLLLLIITFLFPAGWRWSLLALLLLQIALLLLVVSLLLLGITLLVQIALLLLLIIALLFPAGRRRLTLFFAGPLSLAGLGALALIAIQVLGATFLLDHFANRARGESLAGGALDGFHTRAAIRIDGPLMAVEINRLALEVSHYASAANDPLVIHNEIMPAAEMILEMVDVAKHEERRRQYRAARPTGSPADVIIAVAPGDPGGSPICRRNPDPADTWVLIPRPVMITRPSPGFVAIPIPAGVGPFPISDGVRLPIRAYLRGMPAAAIGADIYP